jgi:SM-20-related protein
MDENENFALIQKFEKLISGILENGYSFCDNFLTESEVKNLLFRFTKRYESGQFKAAQIGRSSESTQKIEIRGDEILWLENNSSDTAEQKFLSKNQAFIDYLNQTCYLGIKNVEIHFSKYNTGKFYKRHLDSFQQQKGRILSVIYYLNNNWQPQDGGCLMLYPQKNGVEQTVEIAPIAGRLVCFESEKIVHEVLTTTTERYSITGWFINK